VFGCRGGDEGVVNGAARDAKRGQPGVEPLRALGAEEPRGGQPQQTHPPLEDFTAQTRDIYVAPGDIGFWQGALRDPATARFKAVAAAIEAGDPMMLSILYGDWEGGQRVISLFALRHASDRWLTSTGRHFNVDRPDPR